MYCIGCYSSFLHFWFFHVTKCSSLSLFLFFSPRHKFRVASLKFIQSLLKKYPCICIWIKQRINSATHQDGNVKSPISAGSVQSYLFAELFFLAAAIYEGAVTCSHIHILFPDNRLLKSYNSLWNPWNIGFWNLDKRKQIIIHPNIHSWEKILSIICTSWPI